MRKLRLAGWSLLLFALSVGMWLLLTAFEPMLLDLPQGVERILSLLLLVLPPAIGVFLATLSLRRREGSRGLAVSGILLNLLFAIFFLAIVLFAGSGILCSCPWGRCMPTLIVVGFE
jgi:cytochrome bd-type quinol oxidase subunit 2